ncbi:TIGR04141 family sporadically distributed protein [Kitasatospora sp. NPDC101235]|uniref:TIGR04141 family sporadically distributed protein n=1 Tax=Kitasatospora sp. NPDC101235 TaxID=3364101 RepID=UPI0037FECB6E
MAESQSARVSPRHGQKPFRTDEVTLAGFQDLLDRLPAEGRLEALKRAEIQLMSDTDAGLPVGPATDALKWVSAEVSLGNSHFIRHQNGWYEIGANHLEYVDAEVRKLFEASPAYDLPAWPTEDEARALGLKNTYENSYNRLAARSLGWAFLDGGLIQCKLHPLGFEAADLIAPDGTLVHVKQTKESGPLSHLFVQGHVSADALHTESDANAAVVEAVRKRLPAFPEGRFEPRRVLFAIALKTGAALTSDSLFTVSKISLLHTARALQNLGIEVHIQGIDYRARAGLPVD